MKFLNTSEGNSTSTLPALCLVTVLIGVGAGLGGMFLTLLLHYIQHIAYGYSPTLIISNESFLEGVRASSSDRRFMVLTLCGLIAGFGWWVVYRYGKPLVSVVTAVKSNDPEMPIVTTTIHVLLQIITIALGSPLGREVAPREFSTLIAGWLSYHAGLSLKDTQIMLACGAGAGLAAVYNVPLGGAMFTLEVLLVTWRWQALLPSLATSAIAVIVSWIGLDNVPQYHTPNYLIDYSLIAWSIVAGPIFGISAYWFVRIAAIARKKTQHNWQLPVLCLFNFAIIGLLAIYFPSLLGNGKSPAQIEFNEEIGLGLTTILLLLRTLITWSSLRAGAQGGLLTPSLANGALLATLLGGLWSLLWPGAALGAYALIGATAFLAAAQKMPITAIILIFEFTRINIGFLVPIMFAVTGSVSIFYLCSTKFGLKPQ